MTTKKLDLKNTEKEIIENWKKKNNYLGIKRLSLEELSTDRDYKTRKAIADMRRRKIIFLNKRYYFIDIKKI
jgi:hypothetical protein